MSDDTRNGADPADDAAAVSRPSGKRSARRTRSGSSSADTGSVATIDRPSLKKTDKTAGKGKRGETGNPFKRVIKFLREVIAELRKVIWPNRKQMVTYTSVVLVFVIFMVAYISGLDLAFIKGVNWLFG
ncbi:preprotein translocase subunit SecE [Nocardia puris]|uniref:Protein translocase subunit SecE n=1 Tax=Nocardia puris TaxID=208602 RepID=A0A366DL32_9NOCA|nr:preprotein translocase subunit SecE [Nocardia puris]MBF6211439.1 preprotein translocase subunit SecE [Nocardia puris]MBF6365156.1 preprotein translocase subunit SecE [Nocardia puris]MBF6458942.1 preprotein translocase subunit SecE [Nocardia puris]RBO90797.1 protein translocase subunit secE/sec61 gamma [Nocardia puris]